MPEQKGFWTPHSLHKRAGKPLMASPSSNRIVGRSAFWQRNGSHRAFDGSNTLSGLGKGLLVLGCLFFFFSLSDRTVKGLFGCSPTMKGVGWICVFTLLGLERYGGADPKLLGVLF